MPRAPKPRTHASPAPYSVPLFVPAPEEGEEQDPNRRHPCLQCGKTFTTSGHLARHQRTHTGERNYKCPFPDCTTRCSRQDNLQQHYRVHLSPESKKASNAENRAAMRLARAQRQAARRAPAFAGARRSPSPPPLGDADADILLGHRLPNPLADGSRPTPIYVPASPRTAARLGLPHPAHGPPAPGPCVRGADGRFVPYIPGLTPCIARPFAPSPEPAPEAGPSTRHARSPSPAREPRNLPATPSSAATLSPLALSAALPPAPRARLSAPVLPRTASARGPGFEQDVRPPASLLLTGPGAPGAYAPPRAGYTPPKHAPPDVAALYASPSPGPSSARSSRAPSIAGPPSRTPSYSAPTPTPGATSACAAPLAGPSRASSSATAPPPPWADAAPEPSLSWTAPPRAERLTLPPLSALLAGSLPPLPSPLAYRSAPAPPPRLVVPGENAAPAPGWPGTASAPWGEHRRW